MKVTGPRVIVALALSSAIVGAAAAAPAVAAAPALLAPAASSSYTAAVKPHPAEGYTLMMEKGNDDPTRKPAAYQLVLGKRNIYLERMTWTNWGAATAQGRGYMTYETAAGAKTIIKRYPVKVSVNRLVKREANQVYTKMTVNFLKAAPTKARTMVFSLPR